MTVFATTKVGANAFELFGVSVGNNAERVAPAWIGETGIVLIGRWPITLATSDELLKRSQIYINFEKKRKISISNNYHVTMAHVVSAILYLFALSISAIAFG